MLVVGLLEGEMVIESVSQRAIYFAFRDHSAPSDIASVARLQFGEHLPANE